MITNETSLTELAAIVSDALERQGIILRCPADVLFAAWKVYDISPA